MHHRSRLTLLAGCRSKGTEPQPLPELPPLTVPTIPAEYFGDTIVVPPELQEKYGALLAGTSGIDWDNVDVRTLELDWRRAHLFQQFSDHRTIAALFTVVTFSEPRSLADAIIDQLAATFSFTKSGYYLASEGRGRYVLGRKFQTPVDVSTVGQTAWLADWMLRQYSNEIEFVLPRLNFGHSGGQGGAI